MWNLCVQSVGAASDGRLRALELFRKARVQTQLRHLWHSLIGRRATLRVLDHPRLPGGRGLGRMAVPVAEIVGSEGRASDFDRHFGPLTDRARDRWLSVALARQHGIPLPPVVLLRAADGYYVRDGHHRISVARALGEAYVEAEVVG